MTAVPPPVPPEIVRRAAEALNRTHWNGEGCGTHGASGCSHCYGPSPADADEVAETVLDEVYGDIVEAARRDALAPLRDLAERWRDCQPGAFYPEASAYANGIESCGESLIDALDDLAAGNPTAETAPPRAPTASVSDQGADPRTPTTPGAQIAAEGRDDDDYDDLREENERLLALVAAQAGQIAELRDGMFGWRKHYYDAWAERDASEAKIADLEAAAEHWERVMVVVTDQAAEYVTTFARVRALCDRYRANCDPTSRQAEVAELFRAALDGTEATP